MSSIKVRQQSEIRRSLEFNSDACSVRLGLDASAYTASSQVKLQAYRLVFRFGIDSWSRSLHDEDLPVIHACGPSDPSDSEYIWTLVNWLRVYTGPAALATSIVLPFVVFCSSALFPTLVIETLSPYSRMLRSRK